MEKREGFTHRGKRGVQYPFPEMAQQLGTVWSLKAGEDYSGAEANVVRAAHAWAKRKGFVASTSIPPGGAAVEVCFQETK